MKLARIKLFKTIDQIFFDWNHTVAHAVTVALRNKAHFAGGFARLIASNLSAFDGFRVVDVSALHQHMHSYSKIDGDIDLFFEHSDGFNEFSRLFKQYYVSSKLNGKIIDFVIDDVRLQTINCELNVYDNLSGFDLLNAAVGFDAENVYIPDGWLALESEKMIHVENWKMPIRVIQRVHRWMGRQRFYKLTPKTASEITQQALWAIDYINKEKKKNGSGWVRLDDNTIVTNTTIIDSLKPWMPQLTNEQLLMLTTIVHPTEEFYNFRTPFQILCDRRKK